MCNLLIKKYVTIYIGYLLKKDLIQKIFYTAFNTAAANFLVFSSDHFFGFCSSASTLARFTESAIVSSLSWVYRWSLLKWLDRINLCRNIFYIKMSRADLMKSSEPIWTIRDGKFKQYNPQCWSWEKDFKVMRENDPCRFCGKGNVCWRISEGNEKYSVCPKCSLLNYNMTVQHHGTFKGSCLSRDCPCLAMYEADSVDFKKEDIYAPSQNDPCGGNCGG